MEDGLSVLQRELNIKDIARLIERTARWVDPETFRLLPVWYPEYGRGMPYYNKNWSEPRFRTHRQSGTKIPKLEGNVYANLALCQALGLRKRNRPNWTCCHIWGVDDPKYQKANTVVSDRRFFSCVANMVLLPTPLKAFTDHVPAIKTMLRVSATHLYKWQLEHPDLGPVLADVRSFADWDSYPESWPRPDRPVEPLGVMRLNDTVKEYARRRLWAIDTDLACAGEFYPRTEVHTALDYWNVELPGSKRSNTSSA